MSICSSFSKGKGTNNWTFLQLGFDFKRYYDKKKNLHTLSGAFGKKCVANRRRAHVNWGEIQARGHWVGDILCKDRRDCHVVVETKKGREGDKVVGQTLRYMGWLKKNENKKVRGIIVVSEPDEKLDYAVAATDNIRVKYYKVKFDITDTP